MAKKRKTDKSKTIRLMWIVVMTPVVLAALMLTLAAVVGSLIVSVVKIVYLYKTAAVFRDHNTYYYGM